MMEIILTLYLCSFTTGICSPPFKYDKTFNNYYDCLNTGYIEALKKSEQIGKEKVNQDGIYIRFACIKDTKVKVET